MITKRKAMLALDPAILTGWAITPELSGVWDLSTKRDESVGMRLLHLEAKLFEVANMVDLRLIVYEAARNAKPGQQGALVHQAKLQAIIEAFAVRHAIDYKGYSPKEIKVFATGNGNANKERMVAEAKVRFPEVEIQDDNHADALLLLTLAQKDFPGFYQEA